MDGSGACPACIGRDDVHVASILMCFHRLQSCPRAVKRSVQNNVHHRAPAVVAQLLRLAQEVARGIVNEDIEAPKLLRRPPHHSLHLLRNAHIGRNRNRFSATPPNLRASRLQMPPIAAGQNQPRPQLTKPEGESAPEPRAASSDNSSAPAKNLIFEHSHDHNSALPGRTLQRAAPRLVSAPGGLGRNRAPATRSFRRVGTRHAEARATLCYLCFVWTIRSTSAASSRSASTLMNRAPTSP